VLTRLAAIVIARPRTILITALFFVVACGVLGAGVADRLHGLGATDPSAESSRASAVLADRFPASQPNLALLVTVDSGSVDAPAVAEQGRAITERLRQEPSLSGVTSYWETHSPTLRAGDGSHALIVGRIAGADMEAAKRSDDIAATFAGRHGALTVQVGGQAAIAAQAQRTISKDLLRAELIALPVTLLVLIAVFGSVVAALLPLLVGLVAMVGTTAVLRLITEFTDVSVFAQNLTTALSLGLAIDYALFMVRRYREEMSRGAPAHEAITISVRTAGRTVVFSALVVAIALGAMLVFRLNFLRSFGYVGVSVVLLAAASALIVVPAALVLLGKRLDALDIRRLVRRGHRPAGTRTGWHRLATVAMRFAPAVVVTVVAVLVLLALPFRAARFGEIDDRQLPGDAPARQVAEQIRAHFPGSVTGQLDVVVRGNPATGAVREYTLKLSRLPGVVRVGSPAGTAALGRIAAPPTSLDALRTKDGVSDLSVVSSFPDVSNQSQDLLRAIRGVSAGFDTLVGGEAANLVDTQSAIADRLWLALTIIAVATLVLLFLMTGSILLPVKTIVVNGLSITAMFGAAVWVFQDGHLARLLGFTPVGYIDTTLPVLMFCLAFGLSMDYGVFVQSRIQEEHERGTDTRSAVANGIQRSAGVITAAAGILAIVLVAVGSSGVMNMKMLGVGTAVAVLIDATVVRCLLVPSVMALAGRANWWAPASLKRLRRRLGLGEPPARTESVHLIVVERTAA
jgi:RND superfamily putative drug exporter